MKKNLYIGFDFSINKPACTIYYDGKFDFFIWPLKQSDKDRELYERNNVYSFPRQLDSINSKDYTSSELTEIHTKRSKQLADMIVNTISSYILGNCINPENIYISSEGLSYGSKGDATLNLATYKGVLLVKLIEGFKIEKLFTYSPISLKAFAGCATKEKRSNKNAMIEAFKEETINNKFHSNIEDFKKKTNYTACIDDIVDSYWAVKKMINEIETV